MPMRELAATTLESTVICRGTVTGNGAHRVGRAADTRRLASTRATHDRRIAARALAVTVGIPALVVRGIAH